MTDLKSRLQEIHQTLNTLADACIALHVSGAAMDLSEDHYADLETLEAANDRMRRNIVLLLEKT